MIALPYGSESDWVRNVLAACHARLTIGGQDIELVSPKLIDRNQAREILPKTVPPLKGSVRYSV